MKNKKLLLVAGALVLGASTLASCGSKADLKVWCASDDVPFVQDAAKRFIESNEKWAGKKISVVVTDEPTAPKSLKNDPKASADVFHFGGDSLGELVEGDYLYEISSAFVKDSGIDASVLATGQENGKQYGIPFTPNTFFMFYDASVYTEEDIKSFETMRDKDISASGYKYNFALDLANGWYLQSYFLSNGCTMYEDGKEAIAPRDRALESSKWVWDYLHTKNLFAGDGSAFCGVTNAACVTGTWNAGIIKDAIEKHGGTYAAAPLPSVDFGNGVVSWKSVGDFKHVGVNKVTNEPELACEFAAFLTNKENQEIRYNERKTAPTNAALVNDTTKEWDPAIIAQTEQLKTTFFQPLGHTEHNFWDSSVAFGSDLEGCQDYEIEDWFNKFVEGITLQKGE